MVNLREVGVIFLTVMTVVGMLPTAGATIPNSSVDHRVQEGPNLSVGFNERNGSVGNKTGAVSTEDEWTSDSTVTATSLTNQSTRDGFERSSLSNWSITGNCGDGGITTTNANSGNRSVVLDGVSGGGACYAVRPVNISLNGSSAVLGGYVFDNSDGGDAGNVIFTNTNGSTGGKDAIAVGFSAGSKTGIQTYNASGGLLDQKEIAPLQQDTWYEIELTVHPTNSTVIVVLRKNSSTVSSAVLNTSGAEQFNHITLRGGGFRSYDQQYFDDITISAVGDEANSNETDVDPSDLPGNGTQGNPYIITNASELQAMEDDLSANYTLGADINASGTAQWNNGKGFDPIGNAPFDESNGPAFTGSFDGTGHTISGLTINRSSEYDVGLFGYVDNGVVRNVSVHDVSITGYYPVGGLIGVNENSTIQDASANGTVNGSKHVGGLVGWNYQGGTIQNASASGTVTGESRVGGLVGFNNDMIQNVSASATVNGSGSVGGLVGGNWDGTIQDASASGTVNGSRRVGGLVGFNKDTIQNVSTSGTVNGLYDVGGLVGVNDESGAIQNASVSGTVNGTNHVGGLNGGNAGSIQNASASSSVNGSGNVGGLVGFNAESGTIQNASANGTVTGSSNVGGLVGANWYGTIQNAAASGSVNGSEWVGGLVGVNPGTIQDASASGSVNGSNYVGGLVGDTREGTIRDTFAVGAVTGSSDVGGLVGYSNNSTVMDSYWDVNTTGQATSDGGTPLTTAEMTGEAARTNMTGLAFGSVWTTQPDDYPALLWAASGDREAADPMATAVELKPANVSAANGTTVTFEVVLTDAVGGVGAYKGTVSVANGTVASVTNVSLNGDPGLQNVSYATDGTTVTFDGALADTVDTGEVTIATVTLETTAVGQTDINLSVAAVGNESGTSYTVTRTTGSTLESIGIEKLRDDYAGPPRDVDGDGVFEDINGDGEFNVVDVQALYAVRNTDTVQNNTARFDVNGDGSVDIVDVQALFVES